MHICHGRPRLLHSPGGGREGKIESRRKRGSHPSLTYLGKLLSKLILIGSLESMSSVFFPKY